MKLFQLPGNEGLILLGIIILVYLVFRGSQLLSSRGKTRLNAPLGEVRNYGIGGGAVCPKCQRPFSLSMLSLKIGFVKLVPCPYCGKWSLVRGASQEELRAAEQAELAGAQPAQPQDENTKLKDLVDESRFTDKS
jgi:hypothetical protein